MSTPPPPPRARILVVEDSAVVLIGLETVLIESGYEIVGPAGTVEEALELVDTARFDLALLDVNLHGQPSHPVTDVLVARGIPVIITTGYSAGTLPERFLHLPVCLKPMSPEELLATIERALGRGTD